ncbi:MAG: ATP-binding cassette domain-containing protein [Candidatus Eisenbacteria bacterium]|uniref:ATP-binding cassette domain-containing protein n=1 Tax=Eiseniibacteriota bacterium TaxID=2212470 RepID=A0A849SEL1_UNCEI|nr:ATP-binding cassette domain-containing protein [Candidatus Eisenbacteria bacterium]
MPRRRIRSALAVEVVQTSAMDCGPAALQCLLAGHGLRSSYHRLREQCHTGVDGTSIDALEVIAVQMGLDAEQVMVPTDHLLLRSSRCLPALAVTRLHGGATHFVVVWSAFGDWVQVMDPAIGRLWIRTRRLLASLYQHGHEVDASAYRTWCGGEEMQSALRERMEHLDVSRAEANRHLETASEDSGWRSFARLDAGLRATASLVRGGGARRGSEATAVARTLLESPSPGAAWDALIPREYWSVRPAATTDSDSLVLRGCVLLRTPNGRRSVQAETAQIADDANSTTSAAGLRGDTRDPFARTLLSLILPTPLRVTALLGASILLATLGTLMLAVVLRALAGVGPASPDEGVRFAMVLSLLVLALALTLLEVPLGLEAHRLGRRLEARLRCSILDHLPWSRSRYLSSLPSSDIAERAHALHALHAMPPMFVAMVRAACEWMAMAIGAVTLVPALLPAVGVSLALSLPIALLSRSILAEQDMRSRVFSGALTRLHLDALLGAVPIRANGAASTLRRQHSRLLAEWGRAMLAAASNGLVTSLLLMLIAVGTLGILGLPRLTADAPSGAVLLAVFWTLRLPWLAQRIDSIGRDLLARRNIAQRAMELAIVADDPHAGDPADASESIAEPDVGVSFRAEAAEISRGGRIVLRDLSFEIPGGCRAAIVGPSGGGKSTLVAWMLGWHATTAGRLWVDGRAAHPESFRGLRAQTAWAESETRVWSDSLEQNLNYGLEPGATPRARESLVPSELAELARSLPSGMQAGLGDGGGRLSHGEAQRVRFGRAYGRRTARVVILDEAFSGLDREQRRRLSAVARERWPSATVVCVTHDLLDALHFDRVMVVVDGTIVENGEPPALAASEASQFARLLAEERSALELLDSKRWRRLDLDAGRLHSRHDAP